MTSRKMGVLIRGVCVLTLLATGVAGCSDWLPFGQREKPGSVPHGRLTQWVDPIPASLRAVATETGDESNILPADYVGPETCRKCHPEQYDAWSQHPHRWMNARAAAATVLGDFSGNASIEYMDGRASFFRQDGDFCMRLERDGQQRLYTVHQTIGSRFFQYYVGTLREGPEPADHPFYHEDHVLPFGYWLDAREWVPIVHVGDEPPDGLRFDPFDPPASGPTYAVYSQSCNSCHTTFPLGDLMLRVPEKIGKHAPHPLHFSVPEYLAEAHPSLWSSAANGERLSGEAFEEILGAMRRLDAREHAVTLGVSCEACHLGARAHAEGRLAKPKFFPSGAALLAEATAGGIATGRVPDNINWACGRCHTGQRPQLAAGMATWNSTEADDAFRGACYSELTCTHCHNPHEAIGKQWPLTDEQNDALCLKCHQKYVPQEQRIAHTHHAPGSSGSRCMNCHMPRMNEGLQDVVRTHMIFSPTRADMIEANHPNACNLCHVDQPIDWTLGHLKDWYGREYNETRLSLNYLRRDDSVALGWLKQDNEAIRLLAADALIRQNARWALPELLQALDDPYLLNRQFAQRGLQQMLGISLREFGYRFYMSPEERRPALERLRAHLLENSRVSQN